MAEVSEQTSEQLPMMALVEGEQLTNMPTDLYIPPDALKVILETFEGPLDLLLYLIKRQNLDVLNIPIAAITVQYMEYVELMRQINIELAGEYLLMAAMLAEIKSRMLLPRPKVDDEEVEDPRAELVKRLQEYERFKQAAQDIDQLPRVERDVFLASALPPEDDASNKPLPDVEMRELLLALGQVFKRAELTASHQIERDVLSIRERMTVVLERVTPKEFVRFDQLFTPAEGRMGVVVTFIAILELLRLSMIEMVQSQAFGPIHVKAIAKGAVE